MTSVRGVNPCRFKSLRENLQVCPATETLGEVRISRKYKKQLYNNDLLAVRAVCGELVSGAGAEISLLNTKKQGIFAESGCNKPDLML